MYGASNLSHAQREYISEVIETLHQNETDFVSRLERKRDEKPTNYRGRRVPIETVANGSLAFGNPAGGDLATPGNPTLNHFTVPYVFMNVGLSIDYEAILNGSKGAVDMPLKQAVESTGRQMAKWLNIYASNGDGTTKLATISTAYNAGAPTAFVCNGSTDSIGSTQLVVNQKVKIYDPTGTTQRVGTVGSGALTVATQTKTGGTFTSNMPSDTIVGDIIVPEGVTPSAGFSGVPKLVNNTGTLHGINRATETVTQSTLVNGSAGLSAALLMQTYLLMRQRNGKSVAKGDAAVEMFYGITQQAAYYALTTATAQLLFPRDGQKRPGIDIGGADVDEFSWFGIRMNLMLDWLGSRIDFLNVGAIKTAVLKEAGEMLAPFDRPLPAINGTTSIYKMEQQQWWDVAREYYSPALHKHGVLHSLPIASLPQQKS